MKKIGIIGGLSWESTKKYYQKINQKVNNKLGGNNFAEIVIYSLNFGKIKKLQDKSDWDNVYKNIYNAGVCLEKADVDFIIIASNTIHKIFSKIEKNLSIPIYHIVDGLKNKITTLNRAGMLGTSITLKNNFLSERIEKEYHITIIKPSQKKINIINRSIFNNLVKGAINNNIEKEFKKVLKSYLEKDVKNIILACTELQMLIKDNKFYNQFNFIDTLEEHCNLAVEKSLM